MPPRCGGRNGPVIPLSAGGSVSVPSLGYGAEGDVSATMQGACPSRRQCRLGDNADSTRVGDNAGSTRTRVGGNGGWRV